MAYDNLGSAVGTDSIQSVITCAEHVFVGNSTICMYCVK